MYCTILTKTRNLAQTLIHPRATLGALAQTQTPLGPSCTRLTRTHNHLGPRVLYAQDLTHPSHHATRTRPGTGRPTHPQSHRLRRWICKQDWQAFRASLSHTLPTAAAAVATATPSAGATASIHSDAQSQGPARAQRRPGAAEVMLDVKGCCKACDDRR